MFKRTQLPYAETVLFHGHKLNYQLLGKGDPVIFVHGAFTSSSSYMSALTELSKYYKLYILDLPGFGGSDVVKGKVHNTDLFAEALSTFIKQTKLESAPVIALSLGVISAIKAAANGTVKGKLLLISPPGEPDKGLLTQIFANLPISIRRSLVSTHWGRKNILLPAASANTGTAKETDDLLLEHLSYTSNEAMVDTNFIAEIYSYHQHLKNLKNEVVFIYGENDRMKEHRFSFVKEYEELPGGGHNILSDSPMETVKLLRSLL